ncbi:uncharacterized protein EAF02_003557 [Botrytis sinoallii]|uniref:uncharacterized protein n=1 Tax=Botrytis sinoallii TaxID=1463999 RepID=UPI001901710E|nr:uncharacterized protein EAF02_003557 [Botrytis sinoallii]KAF7886910.1 hypothetical protein EAF02_003557 [Botrytis sinoallii]
MDGVSTAISLFQLHSTCKRIKDDFETHQLKLDIIQLRLSRWGEIAGLTITSNPSKNASGYTYDLASINEILGHIQDRLLSAQREARRLQTKLDGKSSLPLDPESCLPTDLKKIRVRFMGFLGKRKCQASKVIEGIKWDHFDKFVESICKLIDDLENKFPENDREKLRKLSDEECMGISKSNLEELKEVVEGCDPWLGSSVDEKLNNSGAGTVINQSHNTGSTVGIHNGDNKGISYGYGRDA